MKDKFQLCVILVVLSQVRLLMLLIWIFIQTYFVLLRLFSTKYNFFHTCVVFFHQAYGLIPISQPKKFLYIMWIRVSYDKLSNNENVGIKQCLATSLKYILLENMSCDNSCMWVLNVIIGHVSMNCSNHISAEILSFVIWLMGWWDSDFMFCYTVFNTFVKTIFNYSCTKCKNYTIIWVKFFETDLKFSCSCYFVNICLVFLQCMVVVF